MVQKIILLLLLVSCISTPKKLDPKVYYAHDLKIKVNDHQSYGTLVVPKSDKYNIKIKSPGKMSLFILETCHREIPLEDIGRREKLTIIPNKGIENEPGCSMMRISAFDKKKGRHAWGTIVAENEEFTLPANISCNGNQWASRGTTICQSKWKKYQVIEFPVAVKVYSKNCPKLESKNNLTFKYSIHQRDCTYMFVERDGEKRKHYLMTIGYERYPVRE